MAKTRNLEPAAERSRWSRFHRSGDTAPAYPATGVIPGITSKRRRGRRRRRRPPRSRPPRGADAAAHPDRQVALGQHACKRTKDDSAPHHPPDSCPETIKPSKPADWAQPASPRVVTSAIATRSAPRIARATSAIVGSAEQTGVQMTAGVCRFQTQDRARQDLRLECESRKGATSTDPFDRTMLRGLGHDLRSSRSSREHLRDMPPPQYQFLQYLVVPGRRREAGFCWSPMCAPKLPKSDGTITDGRLVRNMRDIPITGLYEVYAGLANYNGFAAWIGPAGCIESADELYRQTW